MITNHIQYTIIGPRRDNEDSITCFWHENICFAAVADGVGGSKCGKYASSESINLFTKKIINDDFNLTSIVSFIHDSILAKQGSMEDCKNMSTTFTGCMIKDSKLFGVHVGDSRLCILRGNGIKQLSINHTEVARLVRERKITLSDAVDYPRKHVIESAIGMKGKIMIQSFEFDLEIGDRIILTTDGIHDIVSKEEFRDFSLKSESIEKFGELIIDDIQKKKLKDNGSFIIIDLIN